MTWRMVSVASGLMVVALAGCSDVPSAPTANDIELDRPALGTSGIATRAGDDAELSQLTQRVLDLKTQVTAAGRITLTHQLELERLRVAVSAWQTRTGRADISVSAPQSLTRRALGNQTGGCDACPIVHTDSPGKVCFLTGQGNCVPINHDNWVLRSCAYYCFEVKSLVLVPAVARSRP